LRFSFHGDANRFNFLVRDSKAVLIDFGSARKCNDQDALHKEFDGLPGRLQDTSQAGGGGVLPQIFPGSIWLICRRVGGIIICSQCHN
jgi:hypothetical protein